MVVVVLEVSQESRSVVELQGPRVISGDKKGYRVGGVQKSKAMLVFAIGKHGSNLISRQYVELTATKSNSRVSWNLVLLNRFLLLPTAFHLFLSYSGLLGSLSSLSF